MRTTWIRLGNWLARCCKWAARRLDDAADAIERCEYCGENKMWGRTCKEVLGYMPGPSRAAPGGPHDG